MSTPDEILKKYEDVNEYHFHAGDRRFIIEAMEDYAKAYASSTTSEKESNPKLSPEITDEEIIKLPSDGELHKLFPHRPMSPQYNRNQDLKMKKFKQPLPPPPETKE